MIIHNDICPARLTDGAVERQRIEALEDALRWVLALAKGYAAAHPVGNNRGIIEASEEVLNIPIFKDVNERGEA